MVAPVPFLNKNSSLLRCCPSVSGNPTQPAARLLNAHKLRVPPHRDLKRKLSRKHPVTRSPLPEWAHVRAFFVVNYPVTVLVGSLQDVRFETRNNVMRPTTLFLSLSVSHSSTFFVVKKLSLYSRQTSSLNAAKYFLPGPARTIQPSAIAKHRGVAASQRERLATAVSLGFQCVRAYLP